MSLTCFMVYFGQKKQVPENDEMFVENSLNIPDFASERLVNAGIGRLNPQILSNFF